MQSLKYVSSFLAVALLLGAAAFAKDANSGKFTLDESARIGSTVLRPGEYKAEWSGSNTALTVSILQHGKTVATTQGTLKELPAKAPADAISIKTLPDKTQQVDEIDFNHRTEALVFSGM